MDSTEVVIAMAENLVPDVCALIMGFLEDIHINLGRQKWTEKISKINAQYKDEKIEERINMGYTCRMNNSKYRQFSFNSRCMDDFHSYYAIYNKNRGCVSTLPPNY
jgi:hypothetical protein